MLLFRSNLKFLHNSNNLRYLLQPSNVNSKCGCFSKFHSLKAPRGNSASFSSLLKLPNTKNLINFKRNLSSGEKFTIARSQKQVGYWLLTCSGMVFGAVALGGITRLTESGLSMVTWKLFGETPPFSETQWEAEFEKYKQYPEFQIKNKEMTLAEFKWIWWMEYIHRMWGRCIGAVYFVPAVIFLAQKKLDNRLKKRVAFMGVLLLCQGLMGWYMVKSGLEDRFDGPNDVPRVSQYRLAAHLTLAFVLYASMLRSALEQLSPALHWPVMNNIRSFKILAHSCKGLVYFTAISGAFVAGLDAGLIYNSFPKMADRWIPSDILALTPAFKNFTENPTTVQFDHRVLGTTTLCLTTALWLWSFRFKLPPGAKVAANAFGIMAYAQVAMGITTLLTYVPVYLAAMHQSGSLILLSLATWLTHEIKYIKKIAK